MQKASLYRHFNARGVLLYVGVSNSPLYRFKSHRNYSHWSDEIVRMDIEHFPCRKSAFAAETAAIKSEKPRHNVRQKPKPKIKLNPTLQQKGDLCRIWGSALDGKHILKRSADIAGHTVTRSQMYNLCGPRSKPNTEI